MKLLTLNCHSWQEDNQLEKIETIIHDIKEKLYDVIALQEVSQSIDSELVEDGIKANNFALVLLNGLKKLGVNNYSMVWDFSHIGYDVYEEGLALLTKHPIVKKHSFFVSKSHDKNYWKTRKVVGATISIENKLMDFYSCHLGWWDDKDEPFKNQVVSLFKKIQYDKITFLMGDFNNNGLMDNEGYSYLMKNKIYDTFFLAKQKDSGITVRGKIDGWNKNKDAMRLDLILVNKEIDVRSSKVIFNGENKPIVSDHYGVAVEI
ncbi:MAG: endonuclease/exonuclease/phosphatase family protein [Clostridia bacterium]|nr:endonuclease/exonuclease/phosphatase family protein [Clostridia bacterium]